MRRAIIDAGILAFVCGAVLGQAVGRKFSFEVASVKPSGPKSFRNSDGGPGSRDPERFTFTRADLRDLLFLAYGVKYYREQISGPGWIDTEDYDIAVKIAPETTKEQFQQMLQNLLAERFNLKVRHDTKALSVYELVVAKNGPKLRKSEENPTTTGLPPAEPVMGAEDKNGFPQLPPGQSTWSTINRLGRSRLAVQRQPVGVLTKILAGRLERPIIDMTGLTDLYDFALEFNPRAATGGNPVAGQEGQAPDIFMAIQQQLGLKLVGAKAPLDVVVVDHAERIPSAN
jgi:uncharacterized protein (TIGR03435 family)